MACPVSPRFGILDVFGIRVHRFYCSFAAAKFPVLNRRTLNKHKKLTLPSRS